MLKNLLFILFLSFVFNTLYAQERHTNTALIETAPGWYKVKPGHNITTSRFLESSASHLGLSANDHLAIRRQDSDKIGFIHTRIYQQYKGIKVWGAEMVLHEKDDRLVSLNGELVKGLELSTVPSIDGSRAIQLAIGYSGASKFAWGKDEDHDFYPKAELLIAQKDFNQKPGDYRLVYKVNVFGIEPFDSKDYFIDAHSGQLLFTLDRVLHTDVTGVAHTKYAGVRNFITDSVGPNHYQLVSKNTLNEIYTYNLNSGKDFTKAVAFNDSDNVWNNINSNKDEVAVDVHWGTQEVVKYFNSRHGLFVNGQRPIKNYVHYDKDWSNAAFSDGVFIYGDGDSINTHSPLTSVDVVAHELTHSITRYSSNLIYRGESGALNESFSDIAGVAIQFAVDSISAGFEVGKKFSLNLSFLRSLKNPNSTSDPDTYLGLNWYTGMTTGEFVHTNSGVQNYWYYLLSEGDTGTNDNNVIYDVAGIGRRKVEQIAFRNLTYYLTPTSDYYDARVGSIFAAEDLFGTCSYEVKETAKAWNAVGIGSVISNRDLALVGLVDLKTGCGLTSSEDFKVLLKNMGCSDTIWQGDSIQVSYQVNNLGPVILKYILPSNLAPGDSLYISDPNALDMSLDTTYKITVGMTLLNDQDAENDSMKIEVTNYGHHQPIDFKILKAQPYFITCFADRPRSPAFEMKYIGCDEIPVGDTIYTTVEIVSRQGLVKSIIDTIILNKPIVFGDIIYDYDPFDGKISGVVDVYGEVRAWIYYPKDSNRSNDTTAVFPYYRPYELKSFRPIAMHNLENANTSRDSMFLRAQGRYSRRDSFATVEFMPGVGANGTQGLQFSGEREWFDTDTVTRYDSLYYLPIGYGRSEVCFCLQTWQWPGDSLFLEFDLRQTASKVWEDTFNKDFKNSSKLWVSRNQSRISEIFYPQTFTQDKFVHHKIDLTSQLGQAFELCLRAENFIAASLDTVAGSLGDNVFIDNIYIHDENHYVGLLETALVEKPIEIYPNPTDGEVSIHLLAGQQGNVQATIYNSALLTVKSTELYLGEGENEFVLDLSSLPAGVYTIKLLGNGFQATEKLVVK